MPQIKTGHLYSYVKLNSKVGFFSCIFLFFLFYEVITFVCNFGHISIFYFWAYFGFFFIVSHLPGGHLPLPKFGHLPPPNSDPSHPQKPNICQEDNCHPNFFLLFLAYFSWLFRLIAHGGHQGWEGGGA